MHSTLLTKGKGCKLDSMYELRITKRRLPIQCNLNSSPIDRRNVLYALLYAKFVDNIVAKEIHVVR